jgi:glycerol uptake facilitator-like aquaporin
MESTTQPTTHKITGRTKASLWLLIAPTAAIVVSLVMFAILNMVANPTMWPTADGEAFAPTPIGITVINILLFIIGVTGVATFFPALVVGIVLLATAKK